MSYQSKKKKVDKWRTEEVLICDYCNKEIERKDKEEVMFLNHKMCVRNYLNRYRWLWHGVSFDKRKSKHLHIKCFDKLWGKINAANS